MALTPEDVVNKRFQPTKFREGYDQDEVDDFLDEVVVELRLRLRGRLRGDGHRGGRRGRLGVDRGRGRRGGGGLAGLRSTGLGRGEPLAQFLVLLVQPAQLDDHLVEEVIDLVLVVALPELRRLEALVDHIFRS